MVGAVGAFAPADFDGLLKSLRVGVVIRRALVGVSGQYCSSSCSVLRRFSREMRVQNAAFCWRFRAERRVGVLVDGRAEEVTRATCAMVARGTVSAVSN